MRVENPDNPPMRGGETTDATQEIEPRANYFIGRVRKDLRGGATRVGGITTLTNRFLSHPDQRARLRSDAQSVGLDLDHRWSNRTYSLALQTAFTNIGGDTAAIRRAQQSPRLRRT